MDLIQIDVLELLPQRLPFILIDKLIQTDARTTTTQFRIRKNHLFCENGRLTECGIIENIAQTCAARMGYINKYTYYDAVKIGFIGSIRNMEIVRLPVVGNTVITQITVLEEIFKMTLVAATVRDKTKRKIASCEMKISITDIERQENE